MRVRSWRYFGVGADGTCQDPRFLGNCAVGEGAVGPAAVEVGGGGVWLGLLAVGSLVERGRAQQAAVGCCGGQERMMCCIGHVAEEGGVVLGSWGVRWSGNRGRGQLRAGWGEGPLEGAGGEGCCAYSCFRELNIKEYYVLDRMVGGGAVYISFIDLKTKVFFEILFAQLIM